MNKLIDKLRYAAYFMGERLKEPSTWQGIGFIVALTGSKIGYGLDWGQAAGLGGIISAVIKMVFPDKKIVAVEKPVEEQTWSAS